MTFRVINSVKEADTPANVMTRPAALANAAKMQTVPVEIAEESAAENSASAPTFDLRNNLLTMIYANPYTQETAPASVGVKTPD